MFNGRRTAPLELRLSDNDLPEVPFLLTRVINHKLLEHKRWECTPCDNQSLVFPDLNSESK